MPVDIVEVTRHYERWLAQRMRLVNSDLKLKHQRMAENPFSFLRATFYRRAQGWPEVCADLAAAPTVLGVGDLHVESFGTWRDVEGRLHEGWLVRRLAPDCSRIELASLPRGGDQRKLLWMMGWETANIHLGSRARANAVLRDLERRKAGWLGKATERMCEVTSNDWRQWRKAFR
jgi:hypothetical protein